MCHPAGALLHAHATVDEVLPGMPGPVIVRRGELAEKLGMTHAMRSMGTVGKDHIAFTGKVGPL